MIIYYTHNYENKKGESHGLLRKAVTDYAVKAGLDLPEEDSLDWDKLRTKGEFGKPYIPGFAPFSISHSNHTWAVLISDDVQECGLDIQYDRKVEAVTVAKRFYAPEDAGIVGEMAVAYGEDDRRVRSEFFRLWARREALVKAAGSSVAGSDVPPVDGDEAGFEGATYLITDIRIPGSDASAAVCILTNGEDEPGMLNPAAIEFREL